MNRTKSPAKSTAHCAPGHFRIIGGLWRSRKFEFPAVEGLRPTPDRVRETLFNWLSPHILNASCLDLFSGSGALGLEALSRGASFCTFIDANNKALAAIQEHLRTLNCDKGKTHSTSLPEGLASIHAPVDVVFLDPPYALHCLKECLDTLISKHLLNDGALIYIECSSRTPLPLLPESLTLHRHKTAGQVQYALLVYSKTSL